MINKDLIFVVEGITLGN